MKKNLASLLVSFTCLPLSSLAQENLNDFIEYSYQKGNSIYYEMEDAHSRGIFIDKDGDLSFDVFEIYDKSSKSTQRYLKMEGFISKETKPDVYIPLSSREEENFIKNVFLEVNGLYLNYKSR